MYCNFIIITYWYFFHPGKLAASALRLKRNVVSSESEDEYVGVIKKEILDVKASVEVKLFLI